MPYYNNGYRKSPMTVINLVADDGEIALGLPVGKHKNKPLRDVPTPYLAWALRQQLTVEALGAMQTEMMRRQTEEPARVEQALAPDAPQTKDPVLVVIDRTAPLADMIETRVKDMLALATSPGELAGALKVAITWAISKRDLSSPAWGANLMETNLKATGTRNGRTRRE